MSTITHRIRHATVEVNVVVANPFRFQQQVATWVHECLLPMLEELFADLPAFREHITVEHLEIEVAAEDLDRWSEVCLAEAQQQIMKSLRSISQAMDPNPESVGNPVHTVFNPTESFAHGFRHYLLHGVLPWNISAHISADLMAQIESWLGGIETQDQARAAAIDWAQTWKDPNARRRFLALPQPLVLRILHRLYGFQPVLAQTWAHKAASLQAMASHPEYPLPLRQSPSLPTALLDETLRALSHHLKLFEHGLADEIFETYAQRIRAQVLGFKQDPPLTEYQASNPLRHPSIPSMASILQSGTYVDHAGLVLAAPFLSMLFERLGLWETSASTLPNTSLALALMHYLVTGKDDVIEFQLPLAKVLCGLPIESAYDLPQTLPENHRVEADALLQSLLTHWDALKDTSIDGLREAFLQRPGKLTLRENDWLLQVEQRPFDMLLQQLPWSLQFIRLPWMPQFLRTEWME